MKLRVSQKYLADALQIATQVSPLRATIPALTCVKLTVKNQMLEIISTDLDIGLKYSIPVIELLKEGTLVISAVKLSAIAREIKDDEIEISSDGPLGFINTKDSRFKLVGMPEEDFPEIPEFDQKTAIAVDAKDLADMIRKTEYAVSQEAVRYALTGQLLEIKGNEIRIVASDGKRLGYVKRISSHKPASARRDIKVIVPPKTLSLLTKVLSQDDTDIQLNVEETQLRLKTNKAYIFSRLIEGTYPDYEAVIPQDRDKKAVVACEPFLSALRKASLMTQEKSRAVKFILSNGNLTLFAKSQDVGEASVKTPASYEGSDFDIVFNPDFVIDYLKVVNEQSIQMFFKDRTSAGLFKSSDDFIYVLMPLSLEGI